MVCGGIGANIWCDAGALFWFECWTGRLLSACEGGGPPKLATGPGPEGAPSGIGGAAEPWFARRPPGLWIAPEMRDATGW